MKGASGHWQREFRRPNDTPLVVVPAREKATHRGSKSAKSARILSPLPSSVHDSTDPSSGCISTRLYSFFACWTTGFRRHQGTGSHGHTHDAVSHKVTAGRHPRRHLGSLDERPERGILEHEIGGYDRAIRRVA